MVRGTYRRPSDSTSTCGGKSLQNNSAIFVAFNASIKEDMQSFPTLAIPGMPINTIDLSISEGIAFSMFKVNSVIFKHPYLSYFY